MPFVLTYLLKLSIGLAVVSIFYQLVLRRITFYNWNRWYLLGYTLLAFFIPFIDVSPMLQQNEWTDAQLLQWVPVIDPSPGDIPAAEVKTSSTLSAWSILLLVFLSGAIFMLARLVIQLISFRRMLRRAQFVSGDTMKLYQVNDAIIPFSFGNSIFINRDLHTPQELEEIIRHEFVHVKQCHSIDIIWGELICLFNWYNPFAWMLKASIRQNLEFIADNKVLQNGINRKQYQYLLLKVIGNNQFSIANQFNFSSLKKRIAMMNKIKTAKVHLLRFLFVLPLLAVLLVSFREKIGDLLARDKQEPTTVQEIPAERPVAKTDVMYIAGKVLDENNHQPVKGFAIKLLINGRLVTTMKTDEDGYYYYADKLSQYKGKHANYEVRHDDPLYYRGSGGTSATDSTSDGLFHIITLASKKVKSRTIAYDFSISASELVQVADVAAYIHMRTMQEANDRVIRIKEMKKLSDEFVQQFPVRNEWFTEYKGNIFGKSGKWLGPKDGIKFYLVDELVDYKRINEYFRNEKDIESKQSGGAWKDGDGWTSIVFDTEEYNKPTPPASVMAKGNGRQLRLDEFIYIPLEGSAVYVNGKRKSTKGLLGWMLGKPGERKKNYFTINKKEITKVYHFTNDMAKYYDPKVNDVYWIEIRNGVPATSAIRFSNYTYTDTTPVLNKKGYYVEIGDDNGTCIVIIRSKDKKEIARVPLDTWLEKESYYENLYGEISPVPPAPPAPPTEPAPPTPQREPAPKKPAAPAKPPVPKEPAQKESSVTVKRGSHPYFKWITFMVGEGEVKWMNDVRRLQFNGMAIVDGQSVVSIQGEIKGLDKENTPIIFIDGKETAVNSDFKISKGSMYHMRIMEKNEAIKKYGAKGKNGAVEIYTIKMLQFGQPSKSSYLFDPYKPKPGEEGC
jgi:beta-lactamase regulating signal transducer with metallopeptidase domain